MTDQSESCEWYDFWQWVEKTMRETEDESGRPLTYRSLEILAGVSNAAVGNRSRNCLAPTETTFDALSAAFGIPKREIMERAGVIETSDELQGTSFREIMAIIKRLSPEEREHALRMLQFQYPNATRPETAHK